MIIVKELESIGELIDFPFLGGQKETVFPRRINYTFRGQNRESYDLRSSLKRNSGSRTDYAEIRLLNNFRKYGELLEPQICKSIWNTMIVAQHHGVPTNKPWNITPRIITQRIHRYVKSEKCSIIYS